MSSTLKTINEDVDTEGVGQANCPGQGIGLIAPRTTPERDEDKDSPEDLTWPGPDWADSYIGRSLRDELEMAEAGEDDEATEKGYISAEEGPDFVLHVQQLHEEPGFDWEMAVLLAMVFVLFPWRAFYTMVFTMFSCRGLLAWVRRSD